MPPAGPSDDGAEIEPSDSPTEMTPRPDLPGEEPPTESVSHPERSVETPTATTPEPELPPVESPTEFTPRPDMPAGPTNIAPVTPPPAGPTNIGPVNEAMRATQVGPVTPNPGYAAYPGMPPNPQAQPYPGGQWPPGPPQRRRSRTPWIIAGVALVCVIALVAGVAIWWTQRSGGDDQEPLLANQLTRSFPTTPSGAAWTVRASDFGETKFVSVLPDANSNGTFAGFGRFGAIVGDGTVAALVGDDYSNAEEGRRLVGIRTATGATWELREPVRACADNIVAQTIACHDQTRIYFIDAVSGRTKESVPLSEPGTYGLAFNGAAAYTRGYSEDTLNITKYTEAGKQWTRNVVLPELAPVGDASTFLATEGLVVATTGAAVVLSARDGREILKKPGRYRADRLPDGAVAVAIAANSTSSPPEVDSVAVVSRDGKIRQFPGTWQSAALMVTPRQRGELLINNAYTDTASGDSAWTVPGEELLSLILASDREVLLGGGHRVAAVDTASGRERWTFALPEGTYLSNPGYDGVTTDGERLFLAGENGAMVALDLKTGTEVWSLPPTAFDGAKYGVRAVGDKLIAFADGTITAFDPTGGRAILPGTDPGQDSKADDQKGGDKYVTPCGSPPVFTPQAFRTTTGGLAVKMKVTAKCPGGDVLYGPQTRITIRDGGNGNALVASGNFDFSKAPVAVGPLGDAGEGIEMELTYPPGSFFRLPDTLGAQSNGAQSNSPGSTFLVDCDKGPTSGGPPQLPLPTEGATATSATATGPSLPAGSDLTATSVDALRVQADSDRAFILANLNNHWVAQLSSKQAGLHADGRVWDNHAILDEFLALRLRFSDVRLLYTDEWSVFSLRGWWVTVAAATFPGPDQANAWCRAQGFDRDHCFAKLVSTTAPPDESTRYWN